MTSADEYRQYAREAARAAAEVESEQDRKALLDLAGVWTRAATKLESLGGSLTPAKQHTQRKRW